MADWHQYWYSCFDGSILLRSARMHINVADGLISVRLVSENGMPVVIDRELARYYATRLIEAASFADMQTVALTMEKTPLATLDPS